MFKTNSPIKNKGFYELARINLFDNRKVVISERAGNISVAQLVIADSGFGSKLELFLKGAMLLRPEQAREIGMQLVEAANKVSAMQQARLQQASVASVETVAITATE